MASKQCVFCGESAGVLRSADFLCGPTYQLACKDCARELENAPEAERIRRALRLGLAEHRQALEARLKLMEEAEEQRPACLRCGTKLKFKQVLTASSLDEIRYGAYAYANIYGVAPACCPNCGRAEFYDLTFIYTDEKLQYLLKKDTEG